MLTLGRQPTIKGLVFAVTAHRFSAPDRTSSENDHRRLPMTANRLRHSERRASVIVPIAFHHEGIGSET